MNDSTSHANDNHNLIQNDDIFQFNRGVPRPEWDNMVRDGFLNGKDVLLLKIVNTLSTKEEGCWASNRYLGESIGRLPNRITDTIRMMKEKNLITVEMGEKDGEVCRFLRLTSEGESDYIPGRKYDGASGTRSKSEGDTPKKGGGKTHPKLSDTPTQNRVKPPPYFGDQIESEENEEEDNKSHCPRSRIDGAIAPSQRSRDRDIDEVDKNQTKQHKPNNTVKETNHTKQTITKKQAESEEEKLAARLKEGLNALGTPTPNYKQKQWAKSFRLLRERDAVPLSQASEVLEWLLTEEVYNHQYTPMVQSAESFRTKFAALKKAMSRLRGSREDSDCSARPPKKIIILTEVQEKILQKLNNYRWPKGSGKQLPEAIQKSYENYDHILTTISKFYDKYVPEGFHGQRWDYYLRWMSTVMSKPRDYVTGYYIAQNERLYKWKNWSGVLPIVSVKDKVFMNDCYDTTTEYGLDAEWWDKLLVKVGLIKDDEQ